ncbi:serine hydrolase domain-containing protein [Sphingomonas sp.]|uniref:serine hydrolase domain-containing protein n=1 Tax=Sphingomonas sp. TaxID=28214 RepID=UPI002DD64EAE|nr:serine hydrolase domain-containing protein [Sphingomonas sp.]
MRITLLIGAAMAAAIPAASQAQSAEIDRVRAAIRSPGSDKGPGCLAGGFRDGKPLFMVSEGLADIATGRQLDGDSRIYAGSMSKQFTALAIAQLVAAGRISLDDDVRKYIPEMPAYEVPVTLGMMMHHSSGIKDWLIIARWAGLSDFSRITKEEALGLLTRQRATNFTPGTDYAYSNGGYLLMAEVVERVTGQSFVDYTRDHIFKKLGMTHSFFLNGAQEIPNLANGYEVDGEKFTVLNNFPVISGSGGLITTMNDFAKYEQDIELGHKVWTPAVSKIMLDTARYSSGETLTSSPGGMSYGGGLAIGKRRGQFFVQHGGTSDTFVNLYARMPERRFSVMVFCNRSDGDPVTKTDAVIRIVQGDIFIPDAPYRIGRFRSDELGVAYDVTRVGTRIVATIADSGLNTNLKSITFSPSSDGSLRALGATLTFSDGYRKFTLQHVRKSFATFVRIGDAPGS